MEGGSKHGMRRVGEGDRRGDEGVDWKGVRGAHLSWHLDDPLRRNDERRMRTERARLFNVLHREATHFIVVSNLTPRAADRYDFLLNK